MRIAQQMQLGEHEMLVRPALEGRLHRVPIQFRLMHWLPPLRGLSAYLMGVGIRAERAPDFARR